MDDSLLIMMGRKELPELRCDDVVVYDNKKTYDRYNIYLQWSSEEDMWDELISSSVNPAHPLGLWTIADSLQFKYDVNSDNEHLGKRIDFSELPMEVQNNVVNYINETEKELNK